MIVAKLVPCIFEGLGAQCKHVFASQYVQQAGTINGIPQLLLGARHQQFNTGLSQALGQLTQHFFTGGVYFVNTLGVDYDEFQIRLECDALQYLVFEITGVGKSQGTVKTDQGNLATGLPLAY